ncbi:hypothetical protein ACFX2I_043161 [Malus domestica]
MFLVFLLFLTINSPTSSSTSDILSRASSLSVEKPEDVLISPDGVFTAVFHQVGNNSYCFAVWFSEPSPSSDSHQNPTVVWKANIHGPVNGKRSKLSLNPPQLRQSGDTRFQRRDWERWGGVVYKGTLSDQRVAAIKQLNAANQGEAEFLAEVSLIGKLYERNLIEMWGYCGEDNHRLLVYEILVPWPRSHLPMCLVGSKGLKFLYGIVVLEMLIGKNPAEGFQSSAESKVGEPGRIEILMKAALQSLEEDKGARPTMSVEYLTS